MSINVTVQPESINAGITQNAINVGIGNSVLWGAIIGKPTGFQPISHDHPQYYLNSNPSGFITFDQMTGAAAGVTSVNGLSGIINILGTGNNVLTLNGNNIIISGQNSSLVSIEGASVTNPNFIGTGNVRLVTIGNNIYISGTGNFISRSETGVFATQILLQESGAYLDNKINDLSGQLVNYALKSETGDFVSKTETGVLATSSRLIQSGANLDNKINNLSGFGAQNYALKSDTGNFISSTQTGVFANNFNLVQTGAGLDNKINSLSGELSSYALKSDTGNFVSKTETGNFATVFSLYLTGQKIDQLSGYSNSSFALKSDTGNFVSRTLTGHLSRVTISGAYSPSVDFIGIGGTLVILSGDKVVISGGAGGAQTGIQGDFVFRSETGAYATAFNLYLTGQKIDQLSGYLAANFALKSDTGNFVSRTQTGEFATAFNLFQTGQALYPRNNPSGFITGNNPLGNPSDGVYGGSNGPIAGIAQGDIIENAFDKIEIILGKLAPSKPLNLSAATFALTNTTYSVYEQGTSTLRTNVINSRIPTGRATGFYDADAGTLSSYINGQLSGLRVLTTGNDIGTYSGLQIYQDADFWSGVAGRAGFWSYLNAYSAPVSELNSGQFSVQLQHSSTGPTATITGYCDRALTPTVGIQTVSTGTPVTRIIDGVPSLATNDPITVNFLTTGTVSAFYRAPMATVSSSQTSSANVNTTGTPLSGQNLALSGTVTVNSSAFITGWIPSVQSFNSIGTASSTANVTTNIYIDTVSTQPASRRKAGVGQYPTGNYGATYDNNVSLATNEELQLINGVIQNPPSRNYVGRSPSGPNYTSIQTGSYNNYRWACFNMGTITADSAITLTFGGTSNFGATPIITNFALYVSVSGSSPTAGWIDGNGAYPGVGNPTNNGDLALVVASSTATAKYITFGSTTRDGTVWVRVGLPSGDNKSFSSITMT